MGCGKTTAGKLLAEKLGCGFFDMDDYITEKEKMETLFLYNKDVLNHSYLV